MGANIAVPAYSLLRDRLREEIIKGKIPAETRLTINETADRYGVSHMPVREAFQWLQGEGLIEIIPHRGARVLSLDTGYISSIYDIRGVMEGLLAKSSLPHLVADDLAKIREHHANFNNSIDKADVNSIYANDRSFHLSIYRRSPNRPALEIYNKYSALLLTLRKKYGFNESRISEMTHQHEAILAALQSGAANDLEAVVRIHAEGGKNDLLDRMARGTAERT